MSLKVVVIVCFEGLASLSRRVWRRFVRGSREISLVPSLHRASTDALIGKCIGKIELFIILQGGLYVALLSTNMCVCWSLVYNRPLMLHTRHRLVYYTSAISRLPIFIFMH